MTNSVRVSDDQDELESCDYVVCVRADVKTPFTDNVFGFCCKCDAKVQHRPHAPSAPKKICMQCAMPDIESEAAKGELEVIASEESACEFTNHIRGN